MAKAHSPMYDLIPPPNGNQNMATSTKALIRLEPGDNTYTISPKTDDNRG